MKNTFLSLAFAAAILSAAVGCSSKTAHVSCSKAPLLAYFNDGAVIDSAVVQRYLSDGSLETIGYAEVKDNDVVWSGKVPEPFIGRILFHITTPVSTGSTWTDLLFEPGRISTEDRVFYHGAKYNDAICDAAEKLSQYGEDAASIRGLVDRFSQENPAAVTGMMLVNSRDKMDFQRWVEVYETMNDAVRNHPLVKAYAKGAYSYLAAKRAQEATAIGATYSDFTGVWEDKEYRLSDFVGEGKYVLVDFWASWCHNCREEIPNILNAYNQYKDKGLEVIGVAIGDKEPATAQAAKEDGINYTVFNETNNSASDAYGIRDIPRIVLIGPDGTILAKDMRGAEIEETVKKFLN